MPDIRMPDGQVVRFPEHFTETQIRGLIASKYPREVGAYGASKPADERDKTGHFSFDESVVPEDQRSQPYMDGSRSFNSGIRTGVEGALGMFGSMRDAEANALGAGVEKLTGSETAGDVTRNVVRYATPFAFAPNAEDIAAATNPIIGEPYQPQTTEGEYAHTAGEFAGGAFGPGGVARKVAQVVVPGIMSEAAGQETKGTPLEPAARFLAGLAGAGATSAPALIASRAPREATALLKDMQAAGRTPQEINQALARLGDDAAPIDLPEFMQSGQRIYAKGGEGRQTIQQFLEPRAEDANWRIRSTLDDTLGPAKPPSRILERIDRNQTALQPQYRDAFRGASPAHTSMIARYLDKEAVELRGEAQRGILKIRGMLNRPGTSQLETNPAVLLETRKAVDGMLETVQDSNARRAFQTARQAIDDALSEAVPMVKYPDANYAELARQKEALQRGQTVLASGREAPWPQELATEFQQGALPQGRQMGPSAVPLRLREGARAEIERIVGTNANDRVALQRIIKGEGDWNRARLSTLFGKDRAERIIDLLDREKAFDYTANRVMRNSATAERLPPDQAGTRGLSIVDAAAAGGATGAAIVTARRLVESALNKLGMNMSLRRDADIARLLTQTDRNQIMTQLMKANGGKAVSERELNSFLVTVLPPAVPISQSSEGQR